MADGLVLGRRLLGWLLFLLAVVALGFLTAPALPLPPMLHLSQVPDWWSRTGPVAAAGSVLRVALLAVAGGWLLLRAAVDTARALRRFGTATRASWTSGWTRIRTTGGLIRLALGLTSSGGVLGACASSGHPAANDATVAAPVLVGPTASAPAVSTTVARSSRTTIAAPVRISESTRTRAASPATRPAAPVRSRRAGPTGVHPDRPAPATWTVRPGDDFWSIAHEVVTRRSSGVVSDGAVANYWSRLIAANRGSLPRPGDPDLLFPGETLALPPV